MKNSDELFAANEKLAFQNEEKQKKAAELLIAYKDLAFEIEEKGKRAAELVIANLELVFQNGEKEKRAAELVIANLELAFQNKEKEKRAAELVIANKELLFQNIEKEKRAAELLVVNRELEQFAYIASHDLREPLHTVSNYIQVFKEDYAGLLDDNALHYLNSANKAIERMNILIKSLLDFSRLGHDKILTPVDCKILIADVITDLEDMVKTSNALIEVTEMPRMNLYEIEMRQVFHNLIVNAIKFRKKNTRPHVKISSEKINDLYKFSVSDNGIGVEPVHFQRIFGIFQRLQNKEEYEGSGIGLANCKKLVQLHLGEIWVESTPGQGATFHFTLSNLLR